ncbi:hypothetical protein FC83_GL000747 [Agrilactobacillus composti DSM 18527 = JCM 14202]|uniref:Uncharacterized protein n=1 Tax=Agrilactobacillus composti DSM 18527 = JCM 14202 TaxID=1423734 RepID=X0PT14_9LACO|nr:YihY/virulence factor BrkB family protein [Agrilactobacillus composti]KRM31452.1 hypothetical protein FC83_GL000747 [Agrilactobacillus composti DSM 18527 = JCM 14202]GAF40406.1 inner membrane protein YihY [Agrilactobacillus composti DSM 18527 = JCM 14202]
MEFAKLKTTIKEFIPAIMARTTDAEVSNSAKVITYYILFSVLPLLIFIGNLLPLFHLPVKAVVDYVKMGLPTQLAKMLIPIMQDILSSSSGGLLSISAVTALWGASRGINILRLSVNKAYQVDPQYGHQALLSVAIRRLIAFFFTLGFVIALFAIFLIFIFGQRFLEWLVPAFHLQADVLLLFSRWKWPVTTATIFFLLWLSYFTLPNAKVKLLEALPGTLITAVSWLAISQGFSFYVTRFSRWSSYGTLGVFVILLFWLNLIFMLYMFGAVFNAVLAQSRHGAVDVRKLGKKTPLVKNIRQKFKN